MFTKNKYLIKNKNVFSYSFIKNESKKYYTYVISIFGLYDKYTIDDIQNEIKLNGKIPLAFVKFGVTCSITSVNKFNDCVDFYFNVNKYYIINNMIRTFFENNNWEAYLFVSMQSKGQKYSLYITEKTKNVHRR